MARARRSFRGALLVLTAAAGCSGQFIVFASLDGSAPQSREAGASNAGAGGAGDLGMGGNRDASIDRATGGNAGVDPTGDGQAPWPCPKPNGAVCHEFIAGDNSNNVVTYVNEFQTSKGWRASVGDTGANSPRSIEIVFNSRAKNQKAVLVSLNKGYAEFDLVDGAPVGRVSNLSGVRGAWRIPDGNTMLAMNDNLVLVSQTGSQIMSFPIPVADAANSSITRNPVDGTFWIIGANALYELGPDARTIQWMAPGVGGTAVRPRPGGGAYVTTGGSATLLEIDGDGHVVSTVGDKGLYPELDYFAGFQPLPNTNFLIANWLGHVVPPGDRPHLVELTSGNQLVWKWGTQTEAREITNVYVFR
jgi:hypothetical protein